MLLESQTALQAPRDLSLERVRQHLLVCGSHERGGGGVSRAYACAWPQEVAQHVVGYRSAWEAIWLGSLVDRESGHWTND